MGSTSPFVSSRLLYEAVPGSRALTPADLWAAPQLAPPVPSPTEPWAVLPITTFDLEEDRGTTQLHRLDLERGSHTPLTSPDRHASNPVFAPDGQRLAFLARPAEDCEAKPQVYVMPIGGGEATRATDLPMGALDMRWLPDGKGLVVSTMVFADHESFDATREELTRRKDKPVRVHCTEERLARFWDRWLSDGQVGRLVHVDLDTSNTRDLMPGSRLWWPWLQPQGAFDVSPDGTEVAFHAMHVGGPEARLRSDVYRVTIADDGTDPCCATEGNRASSSRPRYIPNGTGLIYGRTEDPDFYADQPKLVRHDLASGKDEVVLADWDRTPEGWRFASDGSLILRANDDGRGRAFRLELGAAAPAALTDDGWVSAARPTCDGRVVFTMSSAVRAPEAFVVGMDGQGLRQLTHLTEPALEGIRRHPVHDIRFEGADGDDVQMFVVRPTDADGPTPLVHMIHGGPHGIFGDFWHPRWNAQAFAAAGYTVALVNFHGSVSWGLRYAKCIQGAWGDFPATDIHKATDALITAGWVDETRMAITGGSYGGYLTAWLASTSDRFACAINHAGVYDLTQQYASDVTWGRPQNLGADLWEDAAQVDRWNPLRQSEGLNTPMLVIHGERDFRVPVGQGLLCYGILKARGIPSRLVYFEDENHWVLKPSNSILWSTEVNDWLARWLGPKEDA